MMDWSLPLSPTQLLALDQLRNEGGSTMLASPTGDALVRRGLARKIEWRKYAITADGTVALDLAEAYFEAAAEADRWRRAQIEPAHAARQVM